MENQALQSDGSGTTTLTSDVVVAANTIANGAFTANGTTTLHATLVDGAGNAGAIGQFLSSTSTQTRWIDPPLSNTDSQTIAFGNSASATLTTLEITGGNSLSLQASGSVTFTQTGTSTLALGVTEIDTSKIEDTDGDTQIQVEQGANDNTIRFDVARSNQYQQ